MAKNSIRDFSATAGSNTDIQSVNIDENCPASGINNAIRELMVDLKNVSTGAVNLETPVADTLGVNSAPASGVKLQVKTATDRHLAAFDNSAGPTLGAVTDAAASTTLRLAGSPLVMTGAGGSGAEHVRIDTSGRLLVGRTSTSSVGSLNAQFQVEGTSAPTSAMSVTRNTADNNPPYLLFGKSRGTSDGSNTVVQDDDTLGSITWNGADGTDKNSEAAAILAQVDGTPGSNDMPGRLVFRTTSDGGAGSAERMRIDNLGKVGIGISPSYLLHVDGMIGGKAVEIGRTGGAGHQGGSHFYLGSDLEDPNGITFTNANYRFSSNRTGSVLAQNSNGSGYLYEGTNDDSSSAARKFGVETDGDVRNTNNSYGSLSDQSIKQDIADASSQWEDIKNLRVRKFRLIADVEADADAPYHLGLVAQEVETVSPGLVKVEVQHDALKDADGNPILDDDGELQMQKTGELKAVKYSILYMKAVKALQEAIAKIETLETEMTALKARVTALEA